MEFSTSINSEQFQQFLEKFGNSLGDYSDALEKVADDLRNTVAGQFATEGQMGGTPWAPLAPSTLRRKGKGSSGMLVNTGALFDSLTDAAGPDHTEGMDNLSLTFGTDLPYAIFHQAGAGWGLGQAVPPPPPRQGHGVPMRPILVLTADQEQGWIGFVVQQIQMEISMLGTNQLSQGQATGTS